LDKQVLGRGAVYIYIQFIVSAISGYVFWLIMTQVTTSAVIGSLSVVIAATEILSSVAIVGLPDSLQRFLGKSFYERKSEQSKIYVLASLFILSAGIIIASLFVFLAGSFFELTEFDSNLKIVMVLIIASNSIQTLLSSVVISSLNTRSLPIINILASTVKIVLSIILVLMGNGVTVLAISYLLVSNILSSILLGIITINLLKPVSKKEKPEQKIGFIRASRGILVGGLANWIPLLVTTIGYQLGTILIFGFKGSSDTGVYFLTLSIVSAILLAATSLFTIALPALSSIQDSRKRLAWQTIRWSALISIPLSCSLIFYSGDIMKLFGENYIKGGLSLQILLLSVLPTIIAGGIGNLVFSYGNYRQSFFIDLAMSVPRTALYFTLIPIYGIAGGAISFVIGSLLALVVSIIIISKIKIIIFWKELTLIFIIPIAIGYLMHILQVNYVVGIFVTIVATYFLLLKFHIILRADINDLMNVLPSGISNQISRILKKRD